MLKGDTVTKPKTYPVDPRQYPANKGITNFNAMAVRYTARFDDGGIISKVSRVRLPIAWQATWLNNVGRLERHLAFSTDEDAVNKAALRFQRALPHGATNVRYEYQWAYIEGTVVPKEHRGKRRYIVSMSPPEGANQEWAEACARGKRHLIIAETKLSYVIVLFGTEYTVSKKEWTLQVPWPGAPTFTIRRADKL